MPVKNTWTPRSDASSPSDDGDAARLFFVGGVTVCLVLRRRYGIATMFYGNGANVC